MSAALAAANVGGDADVAAVGALIGDPSRARVLMALLDGRSLAASVLAAEAGVSASTISEHLSRLVDAGLLTSSRQGRSRFFCIARPDVAEALEAIARIAPADRFARFARALTLTRCARHAPATTISRDVLGVALMSGLLDRGLLCGGDGLHHPERAVADRLSSAWQSAGVRAHRTAVSASSRGSAIDLDTVRRRTTGLRYSLRLVEAAPPSRGPTRHGRPPIGSSSSTGYAAGVQGGHPHSKPARRVCLAPSACS